MVSVFSSLNLFAFASLPVSASDTREEKKRSEPNLISSSTWAIATAGEGLTVYQLGQKMEVIGSGGWVFFCPFSGVQLYYVLACFKKLSFLC